MMCFRTPRESSLSEIMLGKILTENTLDRQANSGHHRSAEVWYKHSETKADVSTKCELYVYP